MIKHQLLIGMTAHILEVEFRIKLRIHLHTALIFHRPHMRELGPSRHLTLLPLLRQTLNAHQFCARVLFGPIGNEDMVFVVESGDVFNVVAQLLDGGADFGR